MINKRRIIFLLPYLNVNTTSAERFKSLIKAAEESQNLYTEVIEIDYGIKRSFFSGLSIDEIDNFQPKKHHLIKPKLNYLQIIAFNSLNKGRLKIWRLFQFIHLIFYGKDIFYPKRINVNFDKNNSIKEGYVFCSGSHFSLFSTAKLLAKELNFKLILDYRDPWTFGYNPIDGLKLVHWLKVLIGRNREKSLINYASIITTVSSSLKSFFPIHFQSKVQILPNGSNFLHHEVDTITNKIIFKIVYAGTIYNEQLNDEIFFIAFKEFIADKEISKIKLEFLGSKENLLLKKLINKYNLSKITTITQRLSREALLKHLNDASLFLHLKYQNSNVISSKQAEYLNFCRPILLPISDEGDISKSILENNAGYVCKNVIEIINTLNSLWYKFEKQENLFLNPSNRLIEKISRKSISKTFIDSL